MLNCVFFCSFTYPSGAFTFFQRSQSPVIPIPVNSLSKACLRNCFVAGISGALSCSKMKHSGDVFFEVFLTLSKIIFTEAGKGTVLVLAHFGALRPSPSTKLCLIMIIPLLISPHCKPRISPWRIPQRHPNRTASLHRELYTSFLISDETSIGVSTPFSFLYEPLLQYKKRIGRNHFIFISITNRYTHCLQDNIDFSSG